MFPGQYAPILFSFFLSIFMPFVVSGVATYSAIGLIEGSFETWMISWLRSSIVAFPVLLIVSPLTRKLVDKLTSEAT